MNENGNARDHFGTTAAEARVSRGVYNKRLKRAFPGANRETMNRRETFLIFEEEYNAYQDAI